MGSKFWRSPYDLIGLIYQDDMLGFHLYIIVTKPPENSVGAGILTPNVL